MTNPATTSKPAVNQLLGINDQGEAVGFYNDAKGNAHAYEWDRVSKQFTSIDPPGATSATATAVNDHGSVAGFFTEASGDVAGFIEHAGNWQTLSSRVRRTRRSSASTALARRSACTSGSTR